MKHLNQHSFCLFAGNPHPHPQKARGGEKIVSCHTVGCDIKQENVYYVC